MGRKRSNKDSNNLSCIVLCSDPSVLLGCSFLFIFMSTSGKGIVFSVLWPRKLILTLHSKTVPLLSLHFMVLSPPWPCAGVLRSFLFPNHLVVTVVHFGQQKPSALKQKILDWMAFLSRGVFLSPESRLYLRKKREEDVGQIRHLRR